MKEKYIMCTYIVFYIYIQLQETRKRFGFVRSMKPLYLYTFISYAAFKKSPILSPHLPQPSPPPLKKHLYIHPSIHLLIYQYIILYIQKNVRPPPPEKKPAFCFTL